MVYSGRFSYGNFSDDISFRITRDSLDWSVFFTSLEQNAVGIPAREVLLAGDSISFVLQSDLYTYRFKNKWSDDFNDLSGILLVDTVAVPYDLKKENIDKGNSLLTEEVQFESGGLQLSGTVRHPAASVHKGLVFLTSSGGGDRSGSRAEAIYFAKKGYTTFHYDKRGTGVSEGDWIAADMDELVTDDINAIRYFSGVTGIPLTNIGIKGSSQGAAKVPWVLSELKELAYGVAVSCPGVSLLESDLNYWQNEHRAALGPDLDKAAAAERNVFEFIAGNLTREDLDGLLADAASESWYSALWIPDLNEVQPDSKLNYNPLPYFEKTRQPVLIIQGMSDEIIPPNSYLTISEILKKGGNTTVDTMLLDGTNHSMYFMGKSDFPYWSKLHADYLEGMSDWINSTTAVE